jgi:hypothetical protein
MGWSDTAIHAVVGAGFGGISVPAVLAHPPAAAPIVAIVLVMGCMREQAQFQSDRETRMDTWWENWTQWVYHGDSLREGLAWPVGTSLVLVPVAIASALQ